MAGLSVQFMDQGLHRVVFEALPMPVLVVDQDVAIFEYNSAAAKYLGNEKSTVQGHRCGDTMHCLHASESPDGCGRGEWCKNCLLRNSVREAANGNPVTRLWAPMEFLVDGQTTKVNLWVTSHPFVYEQYSLVLLILEGLGESGLGGKAHRSASARG
jgi:PAS domain-containing protein